MPPTTNRHISQAAKTLLLLLLLEGGEHTARAFSPITSRSASTALTAIIYGWDETSENMSSSPQQPKYHEAASEFEQQHLECPTQGMELAQSYNSPTTNSQDRLARLAAAFAPPSYGLTLQDIDQVHITCVQAHEIQLEAALCENYGCVTLSIPIAFPQPCTPEDLMVDASQDQQGCLHDNLEALDQQSASTLAVNANAGASSSMSLQDVTALNAKASLPAWWVAPSAVPSIPSLEYNHILALLNEDEFRESILAVARQYHQQQQSPSTTVQTAKVSTVGPAGILIKVGSLSPYASHANDLTFSDVAIPFGSTATTVEALRAAVLGLVAAAED